MEWDRSKYAPVIPLKSKPQGIPYLVKPDFTLMDSRKIRSIVKRGVEVSAITSEEEATWDIILKEMEKKQAEIEKIPVLNHDGR